jgi:hypothetical protein
MNGARHRRKGDRIEREVVERHKALGIHAERYPLSGASQFRSSGHDIDVYTFGKTEPPLAVEVKARASGAGFTTIEKWLANYDALFLRRDGADPLGGYGLASSARCGDDGAARSIYRSVTDRSGDWSLGRAFRYVQMWRHCCADWR